MARAQRVCGEIGRLDQGRDVFVAAAVAPQANTTVVERRASYGAPPTRHV